MGSTHPSLFFVAEPPSLEIARCGQDPLEASDLVLALWTESLAPTTGGEAPLKRHLCRGRMSGPGRLDKSGLEQA